MSEYTHILHTTYNREVQQRYRGRGANAKRRIDTAVVHHTNTTKQVRFEHKRFSKITCNDCLFCSQAASTKDALMHCMDSCSHSLN